MTDRPIPDICFTVGLRSLGSFTTSFTRMYGQSPAAYRAAFPPASQAARIPSCFVRAYGRPEHRTFREDSRRPLLHRSHTDCNREREHDHQDLVRQASGCTTRTRRSRSTREAPLELRADVTLPELGGYRWLTVGPPDQPDVSIPPQRDPRAAIARRGDLGADPRA